MSIIASDFIDLESFDQPLAAILQNDCHGHQGANLRWPNIHFCSQDINQHICQIWCLYHKMNNWFGMMSYAAPLMWNIANLHKPLMWYSIVVIKLNIKITATVNLPDQTVINT